MITFYKDLYKKRDLNYKKFIYGLIPGIDENRMIGVRGPDIKEIARHYASLELDEIASILDKNDLYLEEMLVVIHIVNQYKDYEKSILITKKLLKKMDNWLLTDALRPKIWSKNLETLSQEAYTWLSSEEIYTKRFAIGVFKNYYLGKTLDEEALKEISAIRTNAYYLQMMVAWYMAELLVKNRGYFYQYFTCLQKEIQLKTIQKGLDSRRVGEEDKKTLRQLRKM